MYNEDQKMRFIEDYACSESIKIACEVTFNVTEKYEIAWGADLCTQSKEKLEVMFNEIVGFRTRSSTPRRNILGSYCKWCIENNIEGARDEFAKVKIKGADKMKTQTVANPLELQVYLDSLLTPEDDNTIDNIYRAYYWMAFSGMKEEQMMLVTSKDVDFNKLVIKSDGREFPIYAEAVPALRYCVKSTEFSYSHPNYKRIIDRPRVEGDLILRGIKSQPAIQAFKMVLSRKSGQAFRQGLTDLKLSYYRVYVSGIFYRMYQRELAGLGVDFSADAEYYMRGKEYSLESTHNTYLEKKKQVANDFEIDYQRWKKTLV